MTDNEQPLKEKHHLLSFPQEIQDIIFEFAYCRSPDAVLKCCEEWEAGERITKRLSAERSESYAIRPFPNIRVSELLISKQYFLAASRAYVSSQPFNEDLHVMSCFLLKSEARGVVRQFAKKVLAHGYDAELTRALPDLRTVRLFLEEEAWADPKCAWEDELSESAFRKLSVYKKLRGTKGLRHLEIVPKDCFYALSARQKKLRVTNMNALQTFLKGKVTRRRQEETSTEPGSATKRTVPLHPGSEVDFDTSTLLRKPPFTWLPPAFIDFSLEEESTLVGRKVSLRDEDIPDRWASLKALLRTNADGVMDWIKKGASRGWSATRRGHGLALSLLRLWPCWFADGTKDHLAHCFECHYRIAEGEHTM